jgi:hypothetical protein
MLARDAVCCPNTTAPTHCDRLNRARRAAGWRSLGYLVTALSALIWPWPLNEL